MVIQAAPMLLYGVNGFIDSDRIRSVTGILRCKQTDSGRFND